MTHRNKGFTLVELMLAMAFVSILLLSIAMLVLQISTIYSKGLTMRAVNQIGQTITSDMQRVLNTASPQEIRTAPPNASIDSTGARLCVGSTVYAWNYGKSLGEAAVFNKYASKDAQVRLVRFNAKGNKYCDLVGSQYLAIPDNDVTELIAQTDTNIAIHEMSLISEEVTGDPTQRIYTVRFMIGTNETSVMEGNGCKVPETAVDDSYCAVNEFVFTARAGNK